MKTLKAITTLVVLFAINNAMAEVPPVASNCEKDLLPVLLNYSESGGYPAPKGYPVGYEARINLNRSAQAAQVRSARVFGDGSRQTCSFILKKADYTKIMSLAQGIQVGVKTTEGSITVDAPTARLGVLNCMGARRTLAFDENDTKVKQVILNGQQLRSLLASYARTSCTPTLPIVD
jgi:hypothetical protein